MVLTLKDEQDSQESQNDSLDAGDGSSIERSGNDNSSYSPTMLDGELAENLENDESTTIFNLEDLQNTKQYEVSVQLESKVNSEEEQSVETNDENTVSRRESVISESPSIASSQLSDATSLTPSRSLLSPFRNIDSARHHRRLTSLSAPLSQSPSLSALHSRASSVSNFNDVSSSDGPSNPQDVVRWKRLKRISARLYSDPGKRSWGNPTAFCVSGVIAVGTTKGLVLVFDYQQTLRSIMGPGSKAVESGAVTSMALSADHSYLLTGHSIGSIFLWDLSKSAQPARSIPPLSPEEIRHGNASGHQQGNTIIDVCFIGASHSHLVSIDDHGMGFDHTFSRKMLLPSVHSTRIIGKQSSSNRHPSPLMAISPLPLGSASHFSDTLGIVAMITLSRLLIISTVPVPRTQYKLPKPKHSPDPSNATEGACLAWHPSVRYRVNASEMTSKPALAFSWDSYLAILHIMDRESSPGEDEPDIHGVVFAIKVERHVAEPIVAIRWLTHEILLLLTKTHRILILEAASLEIADSGDIVSKSVLHFNYLTSSRKIDQSLNVTLATLDMFHQTLHTFRNKIFMLCSTGILLGTLSTWADRVLGYVERSDFIEAIRLCTSYYAGGQSLVTLGLSTDKEQRKNTIKDKLVDLMLASLRYTFKKETTPRSDPLHLHRTVDSLKKELTSVCVEACICMNNVEFLFDQVYEFYENNDKVLFLEAIENYITSFKIRKMPPAVVKDFIELYCSRKQFGLLEHVICHIDAHSLDIDQAITLCKQNNLFDPQIYIWNEALEDYITPMVEFVQLAKSLFNSTSTFEQLSQEIKTSHITKLFPYLSYILTGRIYPTGEEKNEVRANIGKNALYYFLFSGTMLVWPPNSGELIETVKDEPEPSFPYLRLFLRLDTPTFLQAMDEAFEDPYLNGQEELSSTIPYNVNINRQFIVNILMEVMSVGFSQEDLLFLYIFIARNVPKYPQFIMLSGSTLERILAELCSFKDPEMAEECQLSVEYLLSTFKPFNTDYIIVLYEKAKFWRVLRSVYRSDKKFDKMLLAYFDDSEARALTLVALEDLLRKSNELTPKRLNKIKNVILQKSAELAQIDPPRFAQLIDENLSDMHTTVIQSLTDYPSTQFQYLDHLLGPGSSGEKATRSWITKDTRHLYIKLSSIFRPLQVKSYLESQFRENYQEDTVMSILKEYDILDAMVSLLYGKGSSDQAMDLILDHLRMRTQQIILFLSDELSINSDQLDQLKSKIQSFQQAVLIGRSLCQDLSKIPLKSNTTRVGQTLNGIEKNWLDLISQVSSSIRKISTASELVFSAAMHQSLAKSNNLLIQDLFTYLLNVTSSSFSTVDFIKVLRAFLKQMSEESPHLGEVRETLTNIFDSYIYEPQILSLSLQIIDKDIFLEVANSLQKRARGWRPSGFKCNKCDAKIWGAGAIANIYQVWEKKLEAERKKLRGSEGRNVKGKQVLKDSPSQVDETDKGDFVIFGCGHLYHCLHFSDVEFGTFTCEICREKDIG